MKQSVCGHKPPHTVPRRSPATGRFLESRDTIPSFGVAELRDEVRRLNRSHFRSLSLAAGTCDSIARRYRTLLATDEAVREELLNHCPTSLFTLDLAPCATDHLWAAKDDLVDHLVTARDVARHSPMAAAYVFAVPDWLLTSLENGNMKTLREVAERVHLDLRWSPRDFQAICGFVRTALRGKPSRRTYCLTDTPLVMSCFALRHLNRPDHPPHDRPRRPIAAGAPRQDGDAA